MFDSIFNLIKTLLFEHPFLSFLIFLIIFLKINYKKYRGLIGEYWVKKELKKLPNNEYFVLNDIMIEIENKTYQIDHIVLSKYGIFVIEMKNFYGHIIGKDFNNKWIQRFGNNKYYFNNPLYQNYGHVQALKSVLNCEENMFIPILCFSNQARLSIETKNNVVQLDDLNKLILSYNNEIINVDLISMKEKLLQLNILDRKKRKGHVSTIRTNIKKQNNMINNMICPKCNGALVERNGKYGQFIGCSNYPRCNFIKK